MTKINNKIKQRKFLKIKKKIITIISSKLFIAVFFMIIGAGSAVMASNFLNDSNSVESVQNYHYQDFKNNDRNNNFLVSVDFDPFFDDFFNHDNFFREIKEIENSFDRFFQERRQYLNNIMANYHKNGNEVQKNNNFSGFRVKNKNDENSLIYFLEYKGCDDCDIKVEIKDNFLIFKSQDSSESQEKDENFTKYQKSNSSFYYSLSLPNSIDKDNPKITREKDLISVKFQKK